MKKIIYILSFILVGSLFAGCFSDEGNYDYEELKAPTWNINIENQLQYVTARGGAQMRLDGSQYFRWVGFDSLQRSQDVRYEWRINGNIISTQLTEVMTTDELMKRAGFEDYPNAAHQGHFVIIEKSSGVEFMCRFRLLITPPITSGDFVVYSNKGTHAGKLSVLMLDYKKTANGEVENFSLNQDVVSELPGTPKSLSYALANNVGFAGSITAITQEGDATVFSAGTLKKVWNVGEQFSSGVPADFLVSDRRDQEKGTSEPAFTWVATKDGRVFTRQTGKNYLGGKFLTDPYYLDEKGYRITKFGHTLWGITNIPCYDEKNRRVVLATCLPHHETNNYRCFMKALKNDSRTGGVPLSQMPEDTKVYHMGGSISGQGWFADRMSNWYEMFYTTGGNSWIGTFAVDIYNRNLQNNYMADNRMKSLEGVTFDDETVFLTSAQIRYSRSLKPLYCLFTQGTKVYAVKKPASYMESNLELTTLNFPEVVSKITAMTYDCANDIDYRHLIMGCDNGDILVYDVSQLPAPKLVKKFNVGGRVASVKQIGIMRTTLDMY